MNITIKENGCEKHKELLIRHLQSRIPIELTDKGMEIHLFVDKSIGSEESYLIEGSGNLWNIVGSDEAGLYFGIGKFLHSARWTTDSFEPDSTFGVITPACSYRTIYFAVHCYNWYQMASVEELEQYLEELMLWGYNGIHCIIPVLNLNSFEDELFYHSVNASRKLFILAKKLGMKTSFGINPNQGLITAPHEFDSDPSFDPAGNVRGHLGRNLCPSKPESLAYLRSLWMKMLEQYTDIGLDYIQMWPYDEGGCGCEECRPWGAKGYANLCCEVRKDAVKMYPNAKFVVSCWIFDKPHDQGEYSGLYKRLKEDMDWVDYLMIDAHADFPRYPLEHDVIKPIVNFPEISMWKLYPWGGYGANPLPKRFQKIWDSSKRILQGGQPYSEGIYEDILKIQFVGYYWEPNKSYRDILAEYINYEYSGAEIEPILEMMELIEGNHVLVGHESIPNLESALKAAEIAEKADEQMHDRAKKSWRWRILYARAIIDKKRYEYFVKNGMTSREYIEDLRHYSGEYLLDDNEAQSLFKELRELYHCVEFNNKNQYTLPPWKGGTVLNGLTYEEVKRLRGWT